MKRSLKRDELKIGAINYVTIDMLFAGITRLPNPGEEVSTSDFHIALGGGPIASLITAARLGASVKLVTCLGEDSPSRLARELLEAHGVKHLSLGQDSAGKSPVNISSVITSAAGDRSFISYFPGESPMQEHMDEAFEYLKDCTFCIASEPFPALFRKLREHGCKIAYDVGWSEDLSLDMLQNALSMADIFTPNDKEAMKITGCNTPEEALLVLGQYVSIPVVKIGREGCLILQKGKVIRVPPADFMLQDTTGAGDAFLGGFVYGLAAGWDPYRAARLANYTGGNATTAIGCLTAALNSQEALRFMEG